MSEAVKETLCTCCAHRRVCKYTTSYLDIIRSIDNLPRQPFDYDFVEDITVKCNFYERATKDAISKIL